MIIASFSFVEITKNSLQGGDSFTYASARSTQRSRVNLCGKASKSIFRGFLMRKLFLGFSALLLTLVSTVAEAGFVVDDFSVGTPQLSRPLGTQVNVSTVAPSSFNRTVSLGGTIQANGGQPNIQGSITGGQAKFSFQTVNTTMTLLYNNFGMNVLNTLGSTIDTTLAHVVGPARTYAVTVFGTSSHGNVSYTQNVVLGSTASGFSFNTSLWGNNLAAKTLSSLGIKFERISGGTNNNVNSGLRVTGGISTTGNLVPVPEPGSMVMLGVAGLVGAVYQRRRRAAVSK